MPIGDQQQVPCNPFSRKVMEEEEDKVHAEEPKLDADEALEEEQDEDRKKKVKQQPVPQKATNVANEDHRDGTTHHGAKSVLQGAKAQDHNFLAQDSGIRVTQAGTGAFLNVRQADVVKEKAGLVFDGKVYHVTHGGKTIPFSSMADAQTYADTKGLDLETGQAGFMRGDMTTEAVLKTEADEGLFEDRTPKKAEAPTVAKASGRSIL